MMGTASVIHNGVHIHLKLNSRLPRLSSPYPSPNWSRPHFVHNHIVSVRTEEKRGDSASCDGISNVEISHDDSPEKIKGREAYAASAKTVALWVCAAVAFGIGVGFKDGVGKATEFISGEEDDTDLSNNFIVKTCQRFIPVTSTYEVNRFFTFQDGVRKATPLLLTVAVIELSDVAFAVDFPTYQSTLHQQYLALLGILL